MSVVIPTVEPYTMTNCQTFTNSKLRKQNVSLLLASFSTVPETKLVVVQ